MSPGQKLEKGIAVEKERAEGLAARAEEAVEGATARVAAEGGDGAAVVGEPEKCNTVTFVGADGMEQSFPLDFLLERGAIVANRVNGEDIMSVMGATNQLWVPGLPAKYFVRDIREIRFTNEEVPPVIGPFVDDGHDYTNRPNVAAKAEYVGRVGEPMEFTGWAHDFDKRIIAVEFSLDNGAHWLRSGGHYGRALGVVDLRLHARGLRRLPDEGALGERGRRRVAHCRRAHLRGAVAPSAQR